MAAYPLRQYFEVLRARMEVIRSPFMGHWRDLATFLMPYRQQFTITDNNRGERRNLAIIDSTATLALRELESGLMSGITSPARPWFKLLTSDPKLNELESVKEYLFNVTQIVSDIFLQSNLYNELPNLYGDAAAFGTGILYMEKDYDSVVRFYHQPIGSYMLGNDARLNVATCIRDFAYTVRQVVEEFGTDRATGELDWTNISVAVKNLYDIGALETQVYVTHVCEANPNYDPRKIGPKFKKYRSVYYERGVFGNGMNLQMIPVGPDWNKYLRESGYDNFPFLVFRWKRSGVDIYGTECPGMEALGDIKQLQMGEKRKAQAIEKWVNPPLVGDATLKNTITTQVPGGMNWVNTSQGNDQLKPLYAINPNIQPLNESQEQVRGRINRTFFADIIRMMLDSDRRQPVTATEIEERQSEKEFILGPMMEQLSQGTINPLIISSVAAADDQGLLPDMPMELKGKPVRIEQISVMAQARKALGKAGIVELAQFVNGQIAANPNDPSIGDAVSQDEMIKQFADAVSAPPTVTRTEEDMAAIRKGRAQVNEQKAKQEQLLAGAKAAKDLAGAQTDQPNALTALTQQAQAGSFAPQGA